MDSIYLDNAATTRPWPEVIDAVHRAMKKGYGNASSLYAPGIEAAHVIREAMAVVERAVGWGPWNVIFTSGGSESCTTAVLGTVPKGKRRNVVTTRLEHPAISESCKRVEMRGGSCVFVSGGSTGVVDSAEVAGAVDESTGLCTVTHLAAEMGTVQPIADIARRVRDKKARKCVFHTDASQAFAQLPHLDLCSEVDLVSISAHKIHGPLGVGALLARPDQMIRGIICGGDQQGGIRPGTLNVPGIVGFQKAVELLAKRRDEAGSQMARHTETLVRGLVEGTRGIRALGKAEDRAPGMVVLLVSGVKSEVLLHAAEARGLFASAGSACHTTRKDPPLCIVDAGVSKDEGILRLSLSFDTTDSEIQRAIPILIDAIESVRTHRLGS